jgi:Domain of unknown function (DUF202)
MQTHRSNRRETALALAVGALVFAAFWATGSPENGWLGFVAAGLSLSAAATCTVRWFGRGTGSR